LNIIQVYGAQNSGYFKQVQIEKVEYGAKVHLFQKVKLIYYHYMQSEKFQAFICYSCDDYGLQL